jgi:hypothetical protein
VHSYELITVVYPPNIKASNVHLSLNGTTQVLFSKLTPSKVIFN